MFRNLGRNSSKHPSGAGDKLNISFVKDVEKTIIGRGDALLIIKERTVQVREDYSNHLRVPPRSLL